MKKKVILLIATVLLFNCAENEDTYSIRPGKGSFVFQDEALNYGRPITVFTYRPTNTSAESPILFVIHGNSRTAESYREAWIEIAEKNNTLLLVPHFAREAGFPKDQHFNMGNMFRMDSLDNLLAPNPEEEWAYSLIDPIFDFVVERTKNKSEEYLIYGHSAGSQFVHRFLFFKPDAKVLKAVCANAGWYTFPEANQLFPYGIEGTSCDEEALRKVFAKDVTVLLGDQDIDANHPSLRRTPQAMRQGIHRFQRGHSFFDFSKKLASSLNTTFAWDIQVVPGVGHSNRGMAPGAGEILFSKTD
jgi:hypothetical protein